MVISSSLFRTVSSVYSRLTSGLNYGQDAVLLIMRLYWGWQFFQTGKGKLANFERTVEFFTGLNIPFPTVNAAMAGTAECLGGLLLLLGLCSRIVSLQLMVVMVVAYLTADAEAVSHIFSNPDEFTSASPFLFLLTAIIVAVFGAGRISFDEVLRRYFSAQKHDELNGAVSHSADAHTLSTAKNL
ncbi:MAG: DoxX family protein [Candidatus Kapabacteria bacterium]|jgi:putative oxidoreductase|nr:DoxX family protein [Candidatus Kapabacteria bacterium]